MRPKFSVFRYGDIVATVWSKNKFNKDKKYRFMIFCYGLPSHPYQHNPAKVEKFLEKNFILVYPNYIGTWASYGTMSWENCVDTILQTIKFLKGGSGKETYNNSKTSWKVKDITLVGGSFGGTIALIAGAKSKDVKKIISIAAPTDFKSHNKMKNKSEESLENLYFCIMRGWQNLWRIPNRHEWDRLVEGKADINPVDYINSMKDKDVFLIHGENDRTVSQYRSIELYNQLKHGKGRHKIVIIKDEGHMGNDFIGDEIVSKKVFAWLNA